MQGEPHLPLHPIPWNSPPVALSVGAEASTTHTMHSTRGKPGMCEQCRVWGAQSLLQDAAYLPAPYRECSLL